MHSERISEIGNKIMDMVASDAPLERFKELIDYEFDISLACIQKFEIFNSHCLLQFPKESLSDGRLFLGLKLKKLSILQFLILNLEEDLAIFFLKYTLSQLLKNERYHLLIEDFLISVLFHCCENRNTPLHYASFFGMLDLVKLLLQLGSNPNFKNQLKYTPVDCADSNELRNLFFNLGECPNFLSIKNPSEKNQFLLTLVMQLNLDPSDLPDLVQIASFSSSTSSLDTLPEPFQWVKPILKVKDTITKKKKKSVRFDFFTLLTHSIQIRDLAFIHQLIKENPDQLKKIQTFQNVKLGNNLLHLCCKYKQSNLLNYFLSLKVDINQKNYENLTPFHLAIQAGDLSSLTILYNHPSFNKEINLMFNFPIEKLTSDSITLKLVQKMIYASSSYNLSYMNPNLIIIHPLSNKKSLVSDLSNVKGLNYNVNTIKLKKGLPFQPPMYLKEV